MLIRKTQCADADAVYSLVQYNIKAIYVKFYTTEEVDFFIELHSKSAVEQDIEAGSVYVLSDGIRIFATCTVKENHITRLFVDKAYLGMGYGSMIIDRIEDMIFQSYGECILDTSIPAKEFYIRRGYCVEKKEKVEISKGVYMEYEVMKKKVSYDKYSFGISRNPQ